MAKKKRSPTSSSSSSSSRRCETLGDDADHISHLAPDSMIHHIFLSLDLARIVRRCVFVEAVEIPLDCCPGPRLLLPLVERLPIRGQRLDPLGVAQGEEFHIDVKFLDRCTPELSPWLHFAVNCCVKGLSADVTKRLCEMVGHFAVPLLLCGCSSLVKLHLRLCSFCSFSFSRSVTGINLKFLSICSSEITDKVMHDMLKGSPVLEYLRLEEYRNLKRKFMLCLRSLREIVVNHCFGYALAEGFPLEISSPLLLSCHCV